MKKLIRYLKSLKGSGYHSSDEFLEKAQKRSVGEVWTQPSGRVVRKLGNGSIVKVAAGKSSGKKLKSAMRDAGGVIASGSRQDDVIRNHALAATERMKSHPVKKIREAASKLHESIQESHKAMKKHSAKLDKDAAKHKAIGEKYLYMQKVYNEAVSKHAKANGIKTRNQKGNNLAPITEEHARIYETIRKGKRNMTDAFRRSNLTRSNQGIQISSTAQEH